jgi:hypothetical protein
LEGDEANNPKMMEWMQFMCKRLALKLHPTYLTTHQLYAIIVIHKGVMCNWAEFVNGRIHEELAMRKRAKKVSTLLCGLSLTIQYCMKVSKVNSERQGLHMSLPIALEDYSVHQGPNKVVVQQGERVKP